MIVKWSHKTNFYAAAVPSTTAPYELNYWLYVHFVIVVVCPLIRRDNSDNADTCINRKRERERERGRSSGFRFMYFFCLYCAAVRYEKPTRHPSKASAKKYLKVGKQVTAARGANAGAIKTKARQQWLRERERYAYTIYLHIDMCVCLYRAFNALKTNRETEKQQQCCVYWHGANEARLEKLERDEQLIRQAG